MVGSSWDLLLVIATIITQGECQDQIADPRPGSPQATGKNVFVPQPRIIGGNNARQDRYPYAVSLVDIFGVHSCGGTLVAPDVVLTAAHCQGVIKWAHVGRWNRANNNDGFEEIGIEDPGYPHPLYSDDGFSQDFMLLKLSQPSTKPYIQMNFNPNLPSGERVDEVTVIGFGNTISGVSSLSSILQEVDLTYIANQACESSRDPSRDLSYMNLITDSMLCAGDNGEDSCQGDSGGPLIISGGSSSQDILVGVISWGFGCALPAFPGVYARVSAEKGWLEAAVCEMSDSVPSYINCSDSFAPVRAVPVTIVIQFDDFPKETAWSIVDRIDGTVFVGVPFGTYRGQRSRVQETVFLPGGGVFVFQINDSFGDGLCCTSPGNYVVSLGREPNGAVLVSGGGAFESEQRHEFDVPVDFEDRSQDTIPVVRRGEIPLTIVIQLDDSPQEIGWKIDLLGIEIQSVIEIPAGIYKIPMTRVVRTVVLQEEELYYFRVFDVTSNGITGGYVQLFLGTTDIEDESKMIYEADGDFKGGVDFSFLASFLATMPAEPTPVPQIGSNEFLTLQLYLDLYPGEIAVQLRTSDKETAVTRQDVGENSVIFFRPPRFYTDFVNERISEKIPIPIPRQGSRREFNLIVTDSYADGLCCSWNRTAQTGYTLFRGDPELEEIIVDSRFIDTPREVTAFTIEGPTEDGNDLVGGSPQPAAEAEGPIEIKVTIALDIFPKETGFHIEDLSGFRIADFPPGTYKQQDQVVEEYFTIPAGSYTFTIVDEYGDGINRDGGFYRIDIVGDTERPAILTGRGIFLSKESHTFLLEGDSADYPLTISFSTDDKPSEFGFFIKRLDIPGGDALVASVQQGTYQTENIAVIERLYITKGSLYRVVFEDAGKDGIGGGIEIDVGDDDIDARSYVVDARELIAWQVKLYAGEPPATQPNAKKVHLQMTFDKFPHEVEWILTGNMEPKTTGSTGARTEDQEVISFGPSEQYSGNLAGNAYVETISLPEYVGERTFTMIITDAAGDGVCCTFGEGGPFELFEDTVEQGKLLFAVPFEGIDRIVETFVIVGAGKSTSPPSPGAILAAFTGTFVTLSIIMQ